MAERKLKENKKRGNGRNRGELVKLKEEKVLERYKIAKHGTRVKKADMKTYTRKAIHILWSNGVPGPILVWLCSLQRVITTMFNCL